MLTRILSALGLERRVTDYNPAFAPDVWNVARHPGAGFVTPNKVLSNLAVAVRCVSLRSEKIADVPLKLYRKLPNGDRERVTDNPLSEVLGDLFNPLMTAFEGREFLTRSLDTSGNAYARIERNGAGQVVALWPFAAPSVQVERLESGRLRYRVSSGGKTIVLLQEECLHIRASSEDGLVGRSPIAIARGALGTAIAQNETAETLASNGLRPSVAFQHPGKLTTQAQANISDSYMELNAGPFNAGRPLVLSEGMTLEKTSFSAEDAELLESRKLSNEDVARIFGVPPGSVGISTSVSYGSAQQAAADLVSNCLAPLASRIEQAMKRCLLSTEARRSGLFIEHDLSGLLRGDATARWATYRTAREIGALTNNQILRFENLPGYDGGDDHTPLSLQARGEAPTASER